MFMSVFEKLSDLHEQQQKTILQGSVGDRMSLCRDSKENFTAKRSPQADRARPAGDLTSAKPSSALPSNGRVHLRP